MMSLRRLQFPALAIICLLCAIGCAGREVRKQEGLLRRSQQGAASASSGGGSGGSGATAQASAEGTSGPLHKRGIGWGLNATQVQALTGLAWWYNWGTEPGDAATVAAAQAAGIMFVPMQWGRWGIEQLRVPAASRVLLGMNEPNHHGQANLTPRQAAELWPQLEAVADRLGLRLGSPAAAPCGGDCVIPDPFLWLDLFFHWCQGCRVDFIATHYYACNEAWLRSYLWAARRYQRPVWLTEWACPHESDTEVDAWEFMVSTVTMMDREPWIEKYAWFALATDGWLGTSNSLMDVSTGELTPLGRIYLSYSAIGSGSDSSGGNRNSSSSNGSSSGGSGGSGSGSVGSSSTAGDSSTSGSSTAGKTWHELCQPCIDHLEAGRLLAALPPRQQRYCSRSCGFWPQNPRAGAPKWRAAGADGTTSAE